MGSQWLAEELGGLELPEQYPDSLKPWKNRLLLPDDESEDDNEDGKDINFHLDGLSSLVALALEHHLPLLTDGVTANVSAITVRAGGGAFATVEVSRTLIDIRSRGVSWHGEEHNFGPDRPAGRKVAIKRITRGTKKGPGSFDAIANEIRIVAHPLLRRHDNIVDVIGLGFTGSVHDDPATDYRWPVLMLDFANCGTLEDFFKLRGIDFTWEVKKDISYDIVRGLEALDDAGVLHGDLKLTNVLVSRTGPDEYVAKLCDFATALISTDYDSDVLIRDIVHTPPWNAPEILNGIVCDDFHKVDLYSYGLLVCSIFTEGGDPFDYKSPRPGVSKNALIAEWKQNDEVHTICKEVIRQTDRATFTAEQLDVLDALFDLTVRTDPESRAEEQEEIKKILKPDLAEIEEETRMNIEDSEIMSQLIPPIFSADLSKSVPKVERCSGSLLPKNIATEIFDDVKDVIKAYGHKLDSIGALDRMAAALLELSHAYIQGFGFETSFEEATVCLIKSAELGSRSAQNEMARIFGAMEIAMPPQMNSILLQITNTNALSGSPSALEELRMLDRDAYDHVREELRTTEGGMGFDIFGDDIRSSYPLDDPDEFVRKISHASDDVPIDDDDESGLTWLHYAASNGSVPAVKSLVQQQGCDVNRSTEDNKWTPLYMACNGGHAEVVRILLEKGADATAVSAAGRTCLHYLHMFDLEDIPDIAKRLLDADADIEATDIARQTPLFTACLLNDGEEAIVAAKTLIEHRANPTALSREDYSPIDVMATNLRPELLRVLFSSHVFAGEDGAKKLVASRAQALRSLVKAPKLHRFRNGGASRHQKLRDILELLVSDEVIQEYVTATTEKFNPLQHAATWSGSDLIKPLCSFKGLNVNSFIDHGDSVNIPPLFEALKYDNAELINTILDEGADITLIDPAGRNVLHFVVEFAPRFLPLFLSKLTDAGHDITSFINAGTKERNFTPFDTAVMAHRFQEADKLISLGAQYDELTRKGDAGEVYSTLGMTGGSRSQMSYFLDMPPDRRPSPVVNNLGSTLFHITAVSFDNALRESDPSPADNITFLLEHYFSKHDANQPDNAGNTPLHSAALFGNIAVAQTLLEDADADVNARNKFGSTPLDRLDVRKQGKALAIEEAALVDDLEEHIWEKRNEEMEKLLKSYGGVRSPKSKRKRESGASGTSSQPDAAEGSQSRQ